MNSLVFTSELTPSASPTTLHVATSQIPFVLSILKPQSFDLITNSPDCLPTELHEKNFWRDCFTILKEHGKLNLIFKADQ